MANQNAPQDGDELDNAASNNNDALSQDIDNERQDGEQQDGQQQDDQQDQSNEGPQHQPRGQRRAQDLANKYRNAAQERDQYRDQLFDRTGGETQSDWRTQDIQRSIDQRFFVESVDRDADTLARKYPELDEDSDQFDADLVQNANEMYYDAIGFDDRTGNIRNPIRYRDFMTRYMDSIQRVADGASAQAARNVASQASRTGIRPNSPSRQSQVNNLQPGDISKMSSDEYEKNRSAIDAEIKRQLGID